MKSSFKHPDESPGFLLWKLTTEWQRQQRIVLAEHNLTHVQFVLLACLQWLTLEKDPVVTQSQLAETSKIDKMVVSEAARKLLNNRLITRKHHKSDSRCYSLQLTKKGHQLVDQTLPLVEAVDKQFFSEHHEKINTLGLLASKFKSIT